LHKIICDPVESPVAAVPNISPGAGKESLGGFDAFKRRGVHRIRAGLVLRGQVFDLLHIENRVALQKSNLPLHLVAVVGPFCLL
jgi:hypothetical protein